MIVAEELDHIPLEAAYLCADCDAISNCAMRCPACAGESLLSVAQVLNRYEEDKSRGVE